MITLISHAPIGMFKVKLGIAPTFMNEIFQTRAIPNEGVVRSLRHQTEFYNYKNPKTVYYGTETLRSLGPKYGTFYQVISSCLPIFSCSKHISNRGSRIIVYVDYASPTLKA